MNLIRINITLTETGTRHYLNTPHDLKSAIFISKFFGTLTYIPQDSVLSHIDMYDLSLIVISPEQQYEIEPTLSFLGSDIPKNSELQCRILGRIKEPWAVVMMRDLNIAKPVDIAICSDITGIMQDVIDDIKSNLSHVY